MPYDTIKITDNKIAFVSVCVAILAIILDTSIVRVYRFVTAPISSVQDITTFIIIAIVYSVEQYILLRLLRSKTQTGKQLVSYRIHITVCIIQYALISLLVFVILQMIIYSAYSIIVVTVATMISYALAAIMSGFLSLRFLSWFKFSRNVPILAYSFAAATISVNIGVTLTYVVNVLQGVSAVVEPHIGHITGFTPYSIILDSAYVITSIVSFMVTWIATILLLRQHSRKLARIRYWVLVTIPMAYFMMQFQPLFLDLFLTFRISNPILFDVAYTLVFNLSKPVGGILFGIAFWMIARSIHHDIVRNYLMIAGYGLLILFTSNQATVLINSPYPPFGMVAGSFVGLSSYLILIGLYSSALSVAQDMKLRQSIKNSVEFRLDLLDKIGTAEMEKQTVNNILNITKNLSAQLSDKTGVESSLDDEDIKNYLDEVIKETKGSSKNQNVDKRT
jgi:hypothetical protein